MSIVTATEGNTQQMNVAMANPLRYRGYYYDNETGYYYLQSRYYDPSICRFINADMPEFLGIGESLAKWNFFSYCENEPVGTSDEVGLLPVHIIAGVAIGVAWAVIPRIISDVIRGRMSRISDYIADAVNGAISGLVTSVTGSSTIGTF